MNVYAKIFVGKNADLYANRDAAGVRILTQAGISTPRLLNVGLVNALNAHTLLFEAIPNAQNAELSYQQSSDTQRLELALHLVNVLAQHHEANILQTDLYLKNFLVAGDDIYTLDGDGIRQYRFLSRRRALRNLAVLISKFDVLEVEQWLPKLLAIYAKA